MRVTKISFVVLLCAATCYGASSFAVGGCRPNMVNYPTISAAVSDPATAGSTIFVCAGTYPEQVLITQPLTLEGVTVGGNSAAIITAPSATLQNLNSFSIGTVAYQIAVVNPGGPVNLKNLVVDGTSAAPSDGGFVAGIVYQDASGSVTSVAIRNQVFQNSGTGIIAANDQVVVGAQSLTITTSVIAGFDGSAMQIVGGGTPFTLTVESTTTHAASGVQVALGVAGSVTGTIQSNTFSGTLVGLSLDGTGLTVTRNTIAGQVFLDGSNTVTANHIDALNAPGGVGMVINGAGNVVETNTITNARTGIAGCGDFSLNPPASGSTVIHNAIVNSNVGISMPSGNLTVPNTFELVSTAVQACPKL